MHDIFQSQTLVVIIFIALFIEFIIILWIDKKFRMLEKKIDRIRQILGDNLNKK